LHPLPTRVLDIVTAARRIAPAQMQTNPATSVCATRYRWAQRFGLRIPPREASVWQGYRAYHSQPTAHELRWRGRRDWSATNWSGFAAGRWNPRRWGLLRYRWPWRLNIKRTGLQRDLYPEHRSVWLKRDVLSSRIQPSFDDYALGPKPTGTWRKCFVEWNEPDADRVDPDDREPPEGYSVKVEPWPRGVAQAPRDAIMVFSYITNEEIEETLWFRRASAHDRAWVDADGKDCLWMDSGGRCWLAAQASPPYGTFNGGCARLVEALWRARASQVIPERLTKEGFFDDWTFDAHLQSLEQELERTR
jgi:hypothetical protein